LVKRKQLADDLDLPLCLKRTREGEEESKGDSTPAPDLPDKFDIPAEPSVDTLLLPWKGLT